MAKKKPRKKRKKSHFTKLALALFTILFVYAFYLNHLIVKRFETRRWNLPSRVYSDSFALYPGKPVSASEITDRLTHLNYREVKTSDQLISGEFKRSGNLFTVGLHNFDYPHEKFTGFPIQFEIADNKVSSLSRADNSDKLSVIHLEPELVASVFDDKMEDRTFVAIADVPKNLIRAVILIEDERYYAHQGVDPIGIARAFVTNVLHARVAQGGSTLTQQMVKNFFLTSERTLTRKINEAIMAVLIELNYGKEEILEVYLNEIYFGQRGLVSVTGVAEASHLYFSKDVDQLNLSESALIAAMIRSPGLYSPFYKPENAISRRRLVLNKLLEAGDITKKQFNEADAQPLPKTPDLKSRTQAEYFVDYVKTELAESFSGDVLKSDGLRIFTTLDAHAQRLAQKHVSAWLIDLEKDRAALKKNAAAGQSLEGALVAIQPKTGFIRAYIGGRSYQKSQFDVLKLGFRQPGSTFKPFVYLTALDPKRTNPPFTLASLVADEPLTMKSPQGPWRPQNYDKKFHGLVPLKDALAMSYNVATVKLAELVGFENVVATAKLLGLGDHIEPFGSTMIGAAEVVPLHLAEAYTIFPNAGTRAKALAIRRVVTPEGKVVEKKSIEMKALFDENVIFLMNRALESVLDLGTAKSTRAQGFMRHAGGKTGTTNDYRDAWFVGFTPDLLALTWVGYLDNTPTGLSGGSGALPLWTRFMKSVTEVLPNKDFTAPNDIIIVPLDKTSGKLHRDRCGARVDEYFIEGTEPTEFCE